MKVLQVTPFFPPTKGGIAVHVSNLSERISKLGINIKVISPKKIRTRSSKETETNIERINSIYLAGWPYPTLRSVSVPLDMGFKIGSIIRRGQFDVVHVHGHHYPISWIAINAAHKNEIPVVLTLHGTYALNPYVTGGQSTIEKILNRIFFPRVLRKTSAIIGLTEHITKYAKLISRESATYFTIPNGIDTAVYAKNLGERLKYRIKYGLNSDAILILFRGRFEHVKGVLEFVEAAKSVVYELGRKVEILVVGGGTLEDKVSQKVNSITGIHVLGWQREEEIHELYIASDIFVLPSRFEALPIAIIEAMNAGLHIMYTNVGGVPEVLNGYQRKTLLSEVSAHKIKEVMVDLINKYSREADEQAPSLRYARAFDWNSVASRVREVYREVSQSNE